MIAIDGPATGARMRSAWFRFENACRRCRRRRGGGLRLCSLDVADKAEAALVDGLDQALRLAVIADRLPRRLHPARQRRFRDDAPAPDGLENIVAADDAVAILDEMHKQRENLRLDGQHGPAAPQLLRGGVDLECLKPIDHRIARPFDRWLSKFREISTQPPNALQGCRQVLL